MAVHRHSQSPPESHLQHAGDEVLVVLQEHLMLVSLFYDCCHSPTGVKDAPLIILLEGHFQVTPREQLLSQDCTFLPGPSHSVWIQLDKNPVVLFTVVLMVPLNTCELASTLNSQRTGLGDPGLPRRGRTD